MTAYDCDGNLCGFSGPGFRLEMSSTAKGSIDADVAQLQKQLQQLLSRSPFARQVGACQQVFLEDALAAVRGKLLSRAMADTTEKQANPV